MPITITHRLADVHVTYRTHVFELPDECPNPRCRTRLASAGEPLLREVNYAACSIESRIHPDGEVEATLTDHDSGDTFHPVALHCPNCWHTFAAGEEVTLDA